MNIFAIFARIYLINLPERTDRLAESLAELEKAGLRRDDPRLHIFAAVRPNEAGSFPSIGARGCFLSHLAVIRLACQAQLENVLILEDDIALQPGALRSQIALLHTLRHSEWDFAYLGHHHPLPTTHQPSGIPSNTPAKWQEFNGPLQCAHCYALHRRVLPALHDYLSACLLRRVGDPFGGPIHVDGALAMFRQRHPGCRTLIANPSLAGQRSSRSDIYPNRWFDRWPVVRSVVASLRQLRNRYPQWINRGAAS